MDVAALLRELARDTTVLDAEDEEDLLWTIQVAGALLYKHRLQWQVANQVTSAGRTPRMTQEHVRLGVAHILSGALFDLEPSESELAALADALLALLNAPPRIAAVAAGGFVYTGIVRAVPGLTQMLVRYCQVDGGAAHQAIVAIETILTRTVRPDVPLSEEAAHAIPVALDALGFARMHSLDDAHRARDVAVRAAVAIKRRFGV